MLLIISLPWSIAPMSIAAGMAGSLTLLLWATSPQFRPLRSPVDLPALGWGLALVLSAFFAVDQHASLMRLGKALFPALVLLAAFHSSRRDQGGRAVAGLLVSSALASLFGIVLFLLHGARFPVRARGAAGHYMTYAGQLLLLISLALGVALIARERRWRLGALVSGLLGMAALVCTFTRSAWIGLSVSLGVLLFGNRPRWLPAFVLLLALVYVLVPGVYRTRLHSAFDPHHPTNLERTYMWEAGLRMFRDHPWTGVGLQDLKPIYDRYRLPAAHERAGHLHNVFIQIAATMGTVGLLAFVILYASLFRAAGHGLRIPSAPTLARAVQFGVVAGLAGFLVAGLFEWNFGDEELLYLLYCLVGVAWGARNWDRWAAVAASPPEPAQEGHPPSGMIREARA